MMMQNGRLYEMRPTVSTMADHLNDATVSSSGLPITIVAQEKGTVATALGAADGVTMIRFRWNGPTGLAQFPSWTVSQVEIRPAV
jgi:hypothetical protein